MRLMTIVHAASQLPRRGFRSLGRSIALAALVGVVAGVGAIVFHVMTSAVAHYALGAAVGYQPGGPGGEGELFGHVKAVFQPWMIIPVICAGALVSGWLVYTFAPEAEGHGTDAAIDAYHNKRGIIRPIVPIVKMFASALTLGTGGSGGREGPIAQIGAGFGSFLATRLGLTDTDRRSLMAAGLGAGIGAIFHAPLAGAIFSVEVLYRDPDFEAENLIPSFIATTIAFSVFSMAFPADAFAPLFDIAPGVAVSGGGGETILRPLLMLLPLTVLAAAMALASLVYVRTFYGVHRLFKRMPGPRVFRPVVGALLTGLVALGLFYGVARLGGDAQGDVLSVLSFGYGFLQKILSGEIFGIGGAPAENAAALAEVAGPVAVVLLLVGVGKILTTSLTIGSGGSGGVFGPSMVIGGSLGALVGLGFHVVLPGFVQPTDVVMFSILGMAAFFAAAANTPVSTLLMVSEMTAGYALLLPSMWVCALAYLMSRRWHLYIEQVDSRLDSPAHRGDFIIDVLQGMTVREAMRHATRKFITVPLDMPLREMSRLLTDTRQTCFPVIDAEGRYYGVFSLNDIRQYLYNSPVGDLAVAEDLAMPADEPLTLDLDLSSAISRFTDGAFEELPVVDAERPDVVVGLLRRQDLIASYSARLLAMRRGEDTSGEQTSSTA